MHTTLLIWIFLVALYTCVLKSCHKSLCYNTCWLIYLIVFGIQVYMNVIDHLHCFPCILKHNTRDALFRTLPTLNYCVSCSLNLTLCHANVMYWSFSDVSTMLYNDMFLMSEKASCPRQKKKPHFVHIKKRRLVHVRKKTKWDVRHSFTHNQYRTSIWRQELTS